MIKRTLRSGRTVNSAGHVVVLGDVNPGAKIIAAGDIIIWGRLRGIVHAGADGDEDAVVCALDMNPMQLRIAGYITTSPQDKRRQPKPEIASVRKEQIIVEPWAY
jgi:septum site-determining protein MinC